jgi:hypothetical protein
MRYSSAAGAAYQVQAAENLPDILRSYSLPGNRSTDDTLINFTYIFVWLVKDLLHSYSSFDIPVNIVKNHYYEMLCKT